MPTSSAADTTYAVIKTGGKQYRVTEGQHLLVERLEGEVGSTIELEPILVAGGGNDARFGGDLGKQCRKAVPVTVSADRWPHDFSPRSCLACTRSVGSELCRQIQAAAAICFSTRGIIFVKRIPPSR